MGNVVDVGDYGAHAHRDKSYGDPKVRHRTRPTTDSLQRWAAELAADPAARAVAERVVARLDPADLDTWGTPAADLFAPVDRAAGAAPPRRDWRWLADGYRLRRRVFLALRKDIHQRPHGHLLRRLRYYCDVLLRE